MSIGDSETGVWPKSSVAGPATLLERAFWPKAVLLDPVWLLQQAPSPTAVFSLPLLFKSAW